MVALYYIVIERRNTNFPIQPYMTLRRSSMYCIYPSHCPRTDGPAKNQC